MKSKDTQELQLTHLKYSSYPHSLPLNASSRHGTALSTPMSTSVCFEVINLIFMLWHEDVLCMDLIVYSGIATVIHMKGFLMNYDGMQVHLKQVGLGYVKS